LPHKRALSHSAPKVTVAISRRNIFPPKHSVSSNFRFFSTEEVHTAENDTEDSIEEDLESALDGFLEKDDNVSNIAMGNERPYIN
jgi:hypothetical protein